MSALSLFVQVLVSLILFRLWLQLIAADYYNPVSQAIARVFAPIVNPLQKIIPPIGRFNLVVLLLAVAVYFAYGYFLVFSMISWWQLVVWSLLQTVSAFLGMCFWLVMGSVVMSWLASSSPSPVVSLVTESVAPLIQPIRRWLPSFAGLDFSPIVLFFGIQFLRHTLVPQLYGLAGIPVIGF